MNAKRPCACQTSNQTAFWLKSAQNLYKSAKVASFQVIHSYTSCVDLLFSYTKSCCVFVNSFVYFAYTWDFLINNKLYLVITLRQLTNYEKKTLTVLRENRHTYKSRNSSPSKHHFISTFKSFQLATFLQLKWSTFSLTKTLF